MIKNAVTAAALCALALGAMPAAAAPDPLTFEMVLPETAPLTKLKARFAALPLRGLGAEAAVAQAAAGTTVRMFTTVVNDKGSKAIVTMIGKNPEAPLPVPSTTIKSVLIPIVVNFTSSGIKFDPTLPDAACARNKVPLALTAQSPVFKSVPLTVGGTDLGTGQYVDLFQRANFFKFAGPAGINPDFHVKLSNTPLAAAKVTFNVTGGPAPVDVPCGKIGVISFTAFDNFLQHTVFPALPARVTTNSLAIFLLYGVVLTDGDCCIIGYHSAFSRHGVVQTYAVADYDTSQAFTNLSDVSALSHEIAEWMDDPLVSNQTRPWGNIGQVTGCQSNLEVGDPLSGNTLAAFTMPNHVTYHVQDLAFLSWFYHQSPSIGVNGWFSLFGTFRSAALPCT